MNLKTFQQLHEDGFISDDSLMKVESLEKARLFSLHWELKTLLYLGVTLLSGGLGILVYKNIETIGHQAILAFIALVSIGCFYYCRRKAAPFSLGKVQSPNSFFDYILLLACLTMLTFFGYLQYAYSVFGEHYGLATFIPMVILFFSAYSFDHIGILSLAITNLAAWIGLSIAPMRMLTGNYFEQSKTIYAGIAVGMLLLLTAAMSEKNNIKKHFEFTYRNFGTHIIFIATLAGLFTHEQFYLMWFLLLLAITFFVYLGAMKMKSFYFLLLALLYTYLGLSWVVIQILDHMRLSESGIYLGLLYFIFSAIGLVRLLIVVNRKMKTNDRV